MATKKPDLDAAVRACVPESAQEAYSAAANALDLIKKVQAWALRGGADNDPQLLPAIAAARAATDALTSRTLASYQHEKKGS